jgi:hypothetical protein
MADRFFDTSAIAKHYRVEVGTARVEALLAEAGARHFVSALAVVDLHSVFARLVRTGHITAADFGLGGGGSLRTSLPVYGRSSRSEMPISTAPNNSWCGMASDAVCAPWTRSNSPSP